MIEQVVVYSVVLFFVLATFKGLDIIFSLLAKFSKSKNIHGALTYTPSNLDRK